MGSLLVTMSMVTPSPLFTPSSYTGEKMPKFYIQGQDFEMNFVPHIVLFIFTMDVLNSVTKALADLNGNDSMDLPKRRDDSDSWIENTHLVTPNKDPNNPADLDFGEVKLLQRIADIETKLQLIKGNIREASSRQSQFHGSKQIYL